METAIIFLTMCLIPLPSRMLPELEVPPCLPARVELYVGETVWNKSDLAVEASGGGISSVLALSQLPG